MSHRRPAPNRVKHFRQLREWSQDQLAERAGISRAEVSAIEIQRLVPSVAAALALAKALGCTVEELFSDGQRRPNDLAWAWSPTGGLCRFWQARVGSRILYIPTEPTVAGMLPHDGVFREGQWQLTREMNPERTLVMASCDPAAGLLASAFERSTGFRLLPLHRSSRQALDLLHRGLVDVAGIHLSTSSDDGGNVRAANAVLGKGYSLLRFATWEEGLAVDSSQATLSVKALLQSKLRWVGREAGTGARDCQDEILGDRQEPRRIAKDHRGVAEAIRCGWADVGVCLRLVCAESGLKFIQIRDEAFDFCFPTSLGSDPRVCKLIEVVRSIAFRTLMEPLPGYQLSRTIELNRT